MYPSSIVVFGTLLRLISIYYMLAGLVLCGVGMWVVQGSTYRFFDVVPVF